MLGGLTLGAGSRILTPKKGEKKCLGFWGQNFNLKLLKPETWCRVPAYYALILRSLTVLEGLALGADPQYKLLAQVYPYVAQRLLTDPAPQLRYATWRIVI